MSDNEEPVFGLLQTLYIIQNDMIMIDRSFYNVMLLFFLFPFPQNLKISSLQNLRLLLLVLL